MPQPTRFYLAGVMGRPIMHSRSPMMHNYWFAQQGLSGAYVPLDIEPAALPDALRALPALGFSGCNLTIPHKQTAFAIVDEIDDVARKIGAISCVIVRPDKSLYGTNNDWRGFIGNIKQHMPHWRADTGPALVIGAGGGARAICYALLQEGAKDVRIVNRTFERAVALSEEFDGRIAVLNWEDRHDVLAEMAMIVNVTNQGMVGNPALDLRLNLLPKEALVADIVYTPLETPLLKAARVRGNATINGLGMLLHQGIPAWKSWFNIEPVITTELRQMLEKSIPPDA